MKQGFALAPNANKTIVLFRPSISVGAQAAGGMFEPNAEWTERAKTNLQRALVTLQGQFGNAVVVAPDAVGEDARNVQEHMALFAVVAQAIIAYQFFVGNRLPTKKHDNKTAVFDWSLGQGVARLPGAKDADYGLFIFDKDAYGSTGRKVLQIMALMSSGIAVKSGVHVGYAGLVDLKTGDVLWLNADAEMGGDVREPGGSQKRVRELLKGFPGSAFAKVQAP